MLTARIADYDLHDRGGCLLRLSSSDLSEWAVEGPMLIPGGHEGYRSVPECPDYFFWNGWYYLLFGLGLHTHYRMSREPLGPWLRPAIDTLDNRLNAVIKTAPFGKDRRIGAGWLVSRKDDRDDGAILWGGNVVLREIVQRPDGTLGTAFLAEGLPADSQPIMHSSEPLTPGVSLQESCIKLETSDTQAVARLFPVVGNFRLRCTIIPQPESYAFGIGLRGSGKFETFYPLTFYPNRRVVELAEERIEVVSELNTPFELDIIVHDDIIDVCIGGHRCLINRLGTRKGDSLFLYAECATVTFDRIVVNSIA